MARYSPEIDEAALRLSGTDLPGHFEPRTGEGRTPFANYREKHGSGEEDKGQVAGAHPVDIMTGGATTWQGRSVLKRTNPLNGSAFRLFGSSSNHSSSNNEMMAPRTEATVRKATEEDLKVGLVCADRDGNRIRIDRIDGSAKSLSYHFLNDELRVQEGIQERSVAQFLDEGWYMATPGRSL